MGDIEPSMSLAVLAVGGMSMLPIAVYEALLVGKLEALGGDEDDEVMLPLLDGGDADPSSDAGG